MALLSPNFACPHWQVLTVGGKRTVLIKLLLKHVHVHFDGAPSREFCSGLAWPWSVAFYLENSLVKFLLWNVHVHFDLRKLPQNGCHGLGHGLGLQHFTWKFSQQWPLWHLHAPFHCAGSHKVSVVVSYHDPWPRPGARHFRWKLSREKVPLFWHVHVRPLCEPFPPHCREPWSTQPFFMLHFWFSPTIPTTLTTLSGTILSLPKPFPPHSREPWGTPKPLFMFQFLPSQTLPNPRLGTMKHPNPFSCFIFRTFPSPSHPILGNHEAPKPLLMFHAPRFLRAGWERKLNMKHEKGFGCFSWFLRLGWEGAPTTLLGTILNLPKPFPPHACEPWSTQPPFHASFLAFPDPSQLLSCFVKYAWWNFVSLKEGMRCQVCLVKCRFPKPS